MVTPPYVRAIRPALPAMLPVLLPALSVVIIALASALSGSPPAAGASSPAATHGAGDWTLDAQLASGLQAVVRADGDCLRMREEPDLGARVIICMPEGSLVTVQDGAVEGPEHRWQRVEYRGQSGWAADQYLEPAEEPRCTGQETAAAGLRTEIHPSGVTAIVSRGGTAEGVITAALAQGVHVESIWAEAASRRMLIGFIVGAPTFVNEPWHLRFPEGVVPAGSVLVVTAGEPGDTVATMSLLRETAPPPVQVAGDSAPPVSAAVAVLIDQASGAVLYEKNAHRPLPPASLTKMVTAILAIEGGDLDQWVASEVDSRTMIGSSLMGLLPGDCFQLRDLLYGMMLRSGNDAAVAIGRHIAGSDEAFVEMMNTFVARLGLSNSSFRNPHGLDADGHLTSAFDLAMIARYGMELPAFRRVVAQPTWVARGSRTLWMSNLNRFIENYPGGDGVKTGFTENAGRTLAASATRDGHRMIAVLLNAPDRYSDATRLMNWAFRTHEWPESSPSVAMRLP